MDSDDRFERYPVGEWSALVDALERFAAGGTITEEDRRVTIRAGSSRVSVSADGTVETGMPLHEFESSGIDAVYVDESSGRLQIRDPDSGLRYEFRRP
jgi:uncharacterized protein YraI